MNQRVALITGITGQDGSCLAELLLEKGYRVHGLVRRVALDYPQHRLWRIRHILNAIEVHSVSLQSFASLDRVIRSVQPTECYHLATQSVVGYSFEDEFSTQNANINGSHYRLTALRDLQVLLC
jgi:GDPmannose 4,6-dehydratase